MRFFQYTARNRQNQPVQGTMQAGTEAEARTSLGKFGLQVLTVEELGAAKGAAGSGQRAPILGGETSGVGSRVQGSGFGAQVPPVKFAPPTPRAAAPTASPYQYRQSGNALPGVAHPMLAPSNVIHTVAGTDKQRFFIFSQLASALRAGINPAQAFHEVSQRSAGPFRPSLEEAGAATVEGKAISSILARYPDLYPEHVVGTVRAGEAAGFLPEALEEVARQAESSNAFRRWFFWVWFLLVNFLLSVPIMWILMSATHRSFDAMWNDNALQGQSGLSVFLGAFLKETIWPWGPLTVLIYGAGWAFWRYYGSRLGKPMRHRVGLQIPVYGKRARHENLARFSWTMSRVSRAGIAPNQAWQLAADSVPNLAFRDELLAVGNQMRENTKMSDIVYRSSLFPDEYAPMIATAEYTGDLAGALDHLSNVSAGEFVAAQNYAKARSGCWGFLFLFITSAILAGMFLYTMDLAIPKDIIDSSP